MANDKKIQARYSITMRLISVATAIAFYWFNLSYALPQGGTVVGGSATITTGSNNVTITQNSSKAIINWNGFNIASNESALFNQPGSSAIALNRILSGNPTTIAGLLKANGQVWIVNPAGVLFTGSSQIDVAGLLATTSDINNNDFMNGNYNFHQVPGYPNSSVINNGLIKLNNNGPSFGSEGLVALVAPNVINNGTIIANLGKVALASGTEYTVDMYGDNLITFATNNNVMQNPVDSSGQPITHTVANNGKIIANGGQVYLTANAASQVVNNVISMNGVIEAKSIRQGKNGVIILGGDNSTVTVSGTINVSALHHGNAGFIKIKGGTTNITSTAKLLAHGGTNSGNGGSIETSGNLLNIDPHATLDLTATHGTAGTWLLDPYNIDVVSGATLTNNSGTPNFTPSGTSVIGDSLIITQLNTGATVILDTCGGSVTCPGTDAGNITIDTGANITDSGNGSLTLLASNNITIDGIINLPNGTLTLDTATNSAFPPMTLNGSITQDAAGVISGENLVINTNQGDATLNNTNNDFSNLTATSNSGNISYTNAANSDLNLNASNVGTGSLSVTTQGTGNITQSGALSGNTLNVTTATGNATFNNTNNNFANFSANSTSGTISYTNANNTDLNLNTSNVGTGNLSITTQGTGNITQSGPISGDSLSITTGSGNATLTDASNNFSNLTANSTSGSINYQNNAGLNLNTSTLGSTSTLTVNANGAISQSGVITANTLNTTSSGGTALNTSTNQVSNFQATNTTSGDVALTNGTALTVNGVSQTGGGNVTINNNSSTINIASPITTDGGGVTLTSTSPTTLNASINSSTGNIIFNSAVVLGITTTLTAAQVTFNSTLDALSSGIQGLTIDANAIFDGIVGGMQPLASLLVNGSTNINTSAITTSGTPGTQEYNGAVTLSAAATNLTGSTVTFDNTVDGANALTITGDAVFDNNVGSTPLTSLDITGTTTFNTTSPLTVTTTGDQTFGNNVTLNTDTTLSSGTTVNFDGSVSGANSLTVDTVNDFNINNPITLTTSNGSLTIDSSSGAVNFDAATSIGGDLSVTANNAIAQTAAISVTGTSGFTSNTSTISLNNLSNDFGGAVTLSTTGSNNATIDNNATLNLGTSNVGGTLTATSTANILQSGIITANDLITSSVGGTILNTSTNQVSGFQATNTSSGDIDLNNGTTLAINGISQSGGGNVDINNDSKPLTVSSLISTDGGHVSLTSSATTLSADINAATGNITFIGNVILNQVLTTLTGGLVTFENNLDATTSGGQGLTITGNAEFDNNVGSSKPLSSLDISGTTNFNGSSPISVTTTGTQTYSDAASVNTDTTVSGSTINFDGSVSGANSLTVDTVNDFNINNPITLTTSNGSLTINSSSGAVNFDAAISIGGDLSVTANNAIAQTAAISVTGTSGFTSNTSTISLNNLSNDFGGAVTLSTTGSNNATIDNNAALNLGTSTVGGTLTANSTANILQSGVITANNLVTSSVGGTELNTQTNQVSNFQATNTTSGNIDLTNGTSLTINGTGISQTGGGNVDINNNSNPLNVASTITTDGGNVTLTSSATTLGTDINASTGNINFFGNVILDQPTTNLTGTLVTFNNALDAFTAGSQGLMINGNAAFDGLVGNSAALSSLDVTGNSDINIVTPGGDNSITTTGSQTYAGPVTLTDNTILQGSLIKFLSTVDALTNGGQSLTTNGATEFHGIVGGLEKLSSLLVNGTTDLNATAVNTTGTQEYNGNVTLSTDNNLTGSTITFDDTVNGANNLTVTGKGIFNGEVGNSTPLASLHVTGTSNINTDLIHTSGNQTYDGAATLNSPTTALDFIGNTVTFNNTVDGANAVTVTGNAAFNGLVGNGTPLSSLDVTGNSDINIVTPGGDNSITTTGSQTYEGPVTLTDNTILQGSLIKFMSTVDALTNGGQSLTTNGPTEFHGIVGGLEKLSSLLVNGTTDLNATAVNTTGTQEYNGAVTLSTDNNLTASTVTFDNTVDGAQALTITGNAAFKDLVGNGTPLSSLDVTGNSDINIVTPGGDNSITTTGSQTYEGAVTLTDDTILQGSLIKFMSTVDALTNGGQSLTTNGATEFHGIVGGLEKLSSLLVNGTTDLNATAVNTTGTQEYNGNVTLSTDNNLTGSTITFDDTVNGANNLTVTSNAIFNGEVGNSTPLASLHVTGTSNINTDLIDTSGNQTYDGAVTLNSPTTALNFTGNTVTFNNTVNGANAVTINGNAVFADTVGNSTPLSSLLVNGTTDLNATTVTTAGNQEYNGNVTLSTDNNLITENAGSSVTFDDTVNGAHNLTITSIGIFNGEVGNSTPLSSLHVTGPSHINTDLIETSGTQTYDDTVTLNSPTTAINFIGSLMTFNNTVNGANDVTMTGNATFNNTVGNSTPLNSLLITGNTNINTTLIDSTGTQTYDGSVVLGSPTNALNLIGSLVTLNNTVDGANALTITGNALLKGLIGHTTPLTSLDITGNTEINIPTPAGDNSITTTGTQTYEGPVTLSDDAILQGSQITFDSSVDALSAGVQSLTTTASNTIFNGAVGGNSRLANLTINGFTALNGGVVDTTGNQTYNDLITLGANTILDAGNTGNILIGNGVNGPTFDLTVNNVNILTVNGPVDVLNFTQNQGGNSNLGPPSGGGFLGNIYSPNGNIIVIASSINGNFTGINVFLDGTNGVFGQVTATQLFLSGLNGGSLTNTKVNNVTGPAAADQTRLFTGPSGGPAGAFYVNGRLVTGFVSGDINEILNGAKSALVPVTFVCTSGGPSCANIQLLANVLTGIRIVQGTVFCLSGFAIATDSNGNTRILLPGDKVYADEKVSTDNLNDTSLHFNNNNALKLGSSPSSSSQSSLPSPIVRT